MMPADVSLELLPGDTSRRSFMLSTTAPAATSLGGTSSGSSGNRRCPVPLYFYLRGRDVAAARALLQPMERLLQEGTTLAHVAGTLQSNLHSEHITGTWQHYIRGG